MPNDSNEFVTSLNNNKIRPYTLGMKMHEETIATILLYNDRNAESTVLKEDYDLNFLNELNIKVKSLEPGKRNLSSDTPETPGGTIARFKLDGINDYYGVFNNFSLTNVAESSDEILKINVNFGAHWNAFFFGQQPKVYRFSGFFLDSKEYPYYQEFMVAYEKYLSGRKLIENRMMTKFVYDGRIVDGYMINLATSIAAEAPLVKNFQFSVLVKGSYWIRNNIITKNRDGANVGPMRNEEGLNLMSNRFRIPDEIYKGTIDYDQAAEGTSGKIAEGFLRKYAIEPSGIE